jgi:hypothetical protein
MTTPDIAGLCERLRAVESSGHGGVTTNWHRNPDGIEAADTLERQAAEIERLREAAQAVIDRWEAPRWKDVPATAVFIANLKATLTGEDTATLSLSGKTQTDARTGGDECTS